MRLNEAVARICRSRTVPAKIQSVWDVLADFGAISAWVPDVDHSCLLRRDPVSRRVQVGRTVVVERITEFEPPHLLGYDIEGLPRRLGRIHTNWRLVPSGHHTIATVTNTVDIGTNVVAQLAERGACHALAHRSDTILAGLAKRMEASID